MMDRFRRILRRHPDDEETPLVPKEKNKSISERVTSAIRKRVMKRKGYTKIPSAKGEGRRRKRAGLKRRKRPRKMYK